MSEEKVTDEIALTFRRTKAADFASWVEAMKRTHGWTQKRCARELGCSPGQVIVWSRSPKGAPLYIGLACAAIAEDLNPWTEEAAKAAAE